MTKPFATKHYRWFDKFNPLWNNVDRRQNPMFVDLVQRNLNSLLQTRGYVTLNDALELLGFERTVEGGMCGWVKDPSPEQGDGYIDFGVWDQGFAHGKDWLQGRLDVMTLYFNVDRTPESMPRRIRRKMEKEIRCDSQSAL